MGRGSGGSRKCQRRPRRRGGSGAQGSRRDRYWAIGSRELQDTDIESAIFRLDRTRIQVWRRRRRVLTSCGSREAGACHDDDSACLAILDVFCNGRETSLGECLGRCVVIDKIGMFGAHFLPQGFVQRPRPFVLVAGSSAATYLGGWWWVMSKDWFSGRDVCFTGTGSTWAGGLYDFSKR